MEPFFFNFKRNEDNKIVVGDSSDDDHFNVMLTSKKLLEMLDSNIDGTYKLTKEGFPIIVFAKTDFDHHFHPIALSISSHETEADFIYFYKGLQKIANKLDIEFDPHILI